MRGSRRRIGARAKGWILGGCLVALGAVAAPLPAQEPEAGDDADETSCVCVDVEGIRESADRARRHAERARERVERALERVEGLRLGLSPRARLGVTIAPGPDDGSGGEGVRVRDVSEGSPAAEAGLQEGDRIVALDGRDLGEPLSDPELEDDLDRDRPLPAQRLRALIGRHEPGDEVEVTFLRDGERRTANAELAPGPEMRVFRAPGAFRGGEAPAPPGAPGAPRIFRDLDEPILGALAPGGPGSRWAEACRGLGGGGLFARPGCIAGVRVTSLNEGLGEYFGTDEGVVVLEVAEGSTLGLRPGDVVLAVGARMVEDPDDLRRLLRSYEEDEEVRFRVLRQERELEVTGTAP